MDPENEDPGQTPPATELGEVEDLKKQVTEANTKFEDQRKRAEIAETGLKEKTDLVDTLQKTITPEEKPGTEVPPKEGTPIADPRVDEIQETLRLKDKGYSTEEVEQLRSYAKGQGKTASDMLEDPFAKSVISTMREKSKVDQSTPPPSGRTPPPEATPGGGMQVVGTVDDVKFDDKGQIIKSKQPTFAEYEAKRKGESSAE